MAEKEDEKKTKFLEREGETFGRTGCSRLTGGIVRCHRSGSRDKDGERGLVVGSQRGGSDRRVLFPSCQGKRDKPNQKGDAR